MISVDFSCIARGRFEIELQLLSESFIRQIIHFYGSHGLET